LKDVRLVDRVIAELLDPDNLCHVFVSPRKRAHRTFHLLFESLPEVPSHKITEDVREWDYGAYEGLKSHEIHAKDPKWKIWNDG
jgi:sedoheptulose-bisphosphatase